MEEVKADKKNKKKKNDDKPVKKLGIMDLVSGEVTIIDSVKSFSMPEEKGGWVAILKEKPKKEKEKDADKKESEEKEEKAEKEEKEEDKKKEGRFWISPGPPLP